MMGVRFIIYEAGNTLAGNTLVVVDNITSMRFSPERKNGVGDHASAYFEIFSGGDKTAWRGTNEEMQKMYNDVKALLYNKPEHCEWLPIEEVLRELHPNLPARPE